MSSLFLYFYINQLNLFTMETSVSEFSTSLFLWLLFMVALTAVIIYALYTLYKKYTLKK